MVVTKSFCLNCHKKILQNLYVKTITSICNSIILTLQIIPTSFNELHLSISCSLPNFCTTNPCSSGTLWTATASVHVKCCIFKISHLSLEVYAYCPCQLIKHYTFFLVSRGYYVFHSTPLSENWIHISSLDAWTV